MIDHTGVNVSNLKKSLEFYRQALAPLGYQVIMEMPAEITGTAFAGLGVPPKPDFWIGEGQPQKPHVHIAFTAKNKKEVDDFYSAAIKAGGRDNGPPGPRPVYHPGYYGAFVLDFDGHNIEACYHTHG